MIVTQTANEILLFTQSDHASLASRLLDLWQDDLVRRHPRRSELLFAVREHDNGWQEADSAPRLDARGRPMSFRELPPAERLEVWQRGVERHRTDHPYATLLIARHAQQIHDHLWHLPDWSEFASQLVELVEELHSQARLSSEQVEADYGLLRLADTLSLGACGALSGHGVFSGEDRGRRFALELGRIALEPFPLAGATTLEVACRGVSESSFESPLELAASLSAAKWRRWPVNVEPLQSP